MIQLPQIKARIDHLRELTVNLGKESDRTEGASVAADELQNLGA
jgi:hypothetical protein